MKFSIGQLIIGKPENGYYFTNEYHVCKVVRNPVAVEDDTVCVQVVKGPRTKETRGARYWVDEFKFLPYDAPFEGNV